MHIISVCERHVGVLPIHIKAHMSRGLKPTATPFIIQGLFHNVSTAHHQ